MSQPSTEAAGPPTIPCPPSLTATSPSLPTQTSQALIAHLRANTNAIPELSNILSDSLNRTGWTDRVRALALELLRNGSCDTFPELMAEVLRRAKIPKEDSQDKHSDGKKEKIAGEGKDKKGDFSTANGASTNGTGLNANNAIALSKEWSGGPDGLPDVRIPLETVKKGVEYLEDQIKESCELASDSEGEEDSD